MIVAGFRLNRSCSFVSGLLLLLLLSYEMIHAQGNLLPRPQQLIEGKGQHLIVTTRLNANVSEQECRKWIEGQGGSVSSKAKSMFEVKLLRNIEGVPLNMNEAYRLNITPEKIQIEVVTSTGVFRALQTLTQLSIRKEKQMILPCLSILDWPAFRIRGFMHDVGRSFISIEELKNQIALLARFKINAFHWHLTENQAWRLESRRYPILTDSNVMTRFPGKFYSQAEARELVDWCKAHHVLLIPELDMPGHSDAFVRAFGCDMQSQEGMRILKDLLDEACEVFDVPYVHIGTDEVKFTNPKFVSEMVAHLRARGKKVISWNPGWNYKVGEVDMTQLWSYRGKAQPGIPAIDSRFHYLNHFDIFGDLVALYNSRVYNARQGSDDLAGVILAVWNDRKLETEEAIIKENSFYPHMLAMAERAWLGGGDEYFDGRGAVLETDTAKEAFRLFADFERRLLYHKKHTFSNQPFPYMKQTHVRWRVTDAFSNEGNLLATFPPEWEGLKHNYNYRGRIYGSREARGASIYLRHVWGTLVPAFYREPQENHTAYAYTKVYSPCEQIVGLWVEFQNYSRSEKDLPPPLGKWDYKGSRIWLNDQEIAPPVWTATHREKSHELPLGNENAVSRPPFSIKLNKGWNSVLLKLPIGRFSTEEVRLQKWMFAVFFVTPDGKEAVEGLIYDPDGEE